jgi:hypothetical protein
MNPGAGSLDLISVAQACYDRVEMPATGGTSTGRSLNAAWRAANNTNHLPHGPGEYERQSKQAV